jgi:hypothetical protein
VTGSDLVDNQAAALSSSSTLRITIFNASSGKGTLQRFRLVPRRAHPDVCVPKTLSELMT